MAPLVVRSFGETDLAVDVIVGPGFKNKSDIEAAIADTDGEFTLVADPPDLGERMVSADLAVSAMGMTAYELLATGTPMIGIPQADDPSQLLVGDALAAAGVAEVLEPYPSYYNIADALEKLCVETNRRRELQVRGRELVQHNGARAVYDEIAEEIN
jgi:spore coat polysaccharide biosynthesis predicted glycosyltransferase SpsG